jgi:NAD(P)-dependent dehydrogenase (short-subunit alcohol dehydrogenase family)
LSRFTGKNILVVGATGAFGGEFCAQLNVAGATVIGTASSNGSSVRLPESLTQRLLLDLEDEKSILALTAYLNSLPATIDGIVLAAGLVAFGGVAETPIAVTERLMKVNALGQIALVQQLLPKLQQSAGAGREPFVLSLSGVISESPMPGLAAYSASKTALHGYAIAAAKELRKAGITWSDARPGHTESGLAGRAIFGTAPNFGAGKTVPDVVARMLYGLTVGEKDLPSTAF